MITTGNPASILGRWLNTNRESHGIAECVLSQENDAITVRITGVGEKESWPLAKTTVLANVEEEAGQRTVALLQTFDLGFMTAETHVRVNRGVLVLVLFITFHDNSGRSNYLNREFFYRAG
jgi:hypothetical protein